MRRLFFGFAAAGLLACLFSPPASAVQSEVSVDGQPVRYAFVQGDAQKFQEQQWMRDGYGGGIEEFTVDETKLPEDIHVYMRGSEVTADDDYSGETLIEKKDFGYLHFDFDQFTKYFDNTGGVYYPFTTLRENTLPDRELALRIGRLSVEAGLTVEDFPEIRFLYERHYKYGSKSHLTWTPVTEGTLTRNIGPSYQDIKEAVDDVAIHVNHTIKGIDLTGEQRWEFADTETARYERSLSTNSTAAERKIRRQNQEPQARVMSTLAGAERWSDDERLFTGGAYHFVHLSNQEVENIFEMNENGTLFNFTNPKQIRGARAENTYNDHTWVADVMVVPWQSFSVTAKLKTEATGRKGNSNYPSDTTAGVPDGIINNDDVSRTEDKVARLGEGVSLRYTGVPRTALYNDFEFEQVRNWLGEDRDSIAGQSAASAGEIFSRETITRILSGVWTLGGQTVPWNFLNMTAHLRYRRDNNDMDDQRETVATATGAKSAFFDALNLSTKELATKITWKPRPWFRPAVRYQFQMRDYMSRVEDQREVQTNMDSHIFTFEISLQPVARLLIVSALSPQYAWVETPARYVGQAGTPRFQANLISWMNSVNYDVNENVSLNGGFEYSRADNFNDFAASGLPLAADYNQTSVFCGAQWVLNSWVTLSADYGFYHYGADPSVDSGSYDANVIWLKTILNWG